VLNLLFGESLIGEWVVATSSALSGQVVAEAVSVTSSVGVRVGVGERAGVVGV